MARSASVHRTTSTQRLTSAYRQTSGYMIAPGLTPPDAANTDARPAADHGAGTAPPERGGDVEAAAQAGMTDISIKIRLIGAFVVIAVAALATAFITGLQLDGVTAAVPQDLAAEDRAAIRDAVGGARTMAYITAGTTALLAVILGTVIAVGIANPIQRVTRALSRLSGGDTNVEIPQARSADELGVMAGTLATFKERTLENQRMIQERAEEQRRQEDEQRQLRERLANDLESTVSSQVGQAEQEVGGLRRLAEQMFESQRVANERARDVGQASGRASEIATSFAGSVEELSNAITDIEQRVDQTTEMSNQAAEDTRQADSDINALVQAADSITQVIDLINDIAGKTNMLALNAAVEAERAGKAGRSFQVVAREVKNLSRQTAEATKQVESHVADIRTKTDNTAKRMRGIIDVIGMINTAAADIKAAVEQQSQTASQISKDAHEASEQTQVMQQGIESVAQQTQDTENAAGKVRDSAETVGTSVESIRREVDRFLENTVKAQHS